MLAGAGAVALLAVVVLMTTIEQKAIEAAARIVSEEMICAGYPFETCQRGECVCRKVTRAAIDAYKAAMWQPLATIVKEEPVLAATPSGTIYFLQDGIGHALRIVSGSYNEAIIRWRPLPQPPKVKP